VVHGGHLSSTEPADSTSKPASFLGEAFNQIGRISRNRDRRDLLKFDLSQLWQSTAWRASPLMLRAAPGGNAEADADQKCNRAADATPRPGVMRKD
jgi:hypothetical protein